ncbi:hypothetical protein ACFQAT_05090 [Undibacterium arcticum]
MVEMRKEGVEIPRRMLKDRSTKQWKGTLAILDTTGQGLHRQVKIARHTYGEGLGQIVHEILDPHIVWANDEKFVLTGFERRRSGESLVDYAQSWLCIVGWGE